MWGVKNGGGEATLKKGSLLSHASESVFFFKIGEIPLTPLKK